MVDKIFLYGLVLLKKPSKMFSLLSAWYINKNIALKPSPFPSAPLDGHSKMVVLFCGSLYRDNDPLYRRMMQEF